jgi:hypothetical protein
MEGGFQIELHCTHYCADGEFKRFAGGFPLKCGEGTGARLSWRCALFFYPVVAGNAALPGKSFRFGKTGALAHVCFVFGSYQPRILEGIVRAALVIVAQQPGEAAQGKVLPEHVPRLFTELPGEPHEGVLCISQG